MRAPLAFDPSARIVGAERSVIGWLAAALPAAAFLALVKHAVAVGVFT
jgi:hypothetical protein